MKKPTKATLYKEVDLLQAEVDRLKAELKASQGEVSRLKAVLSLVWQSRRQARYWLKDAREEAGQLLTSLLRRI